MSINGYYSPYSSYPSNSYPSGLGSSSSVSGNAGASDVNFSNGYSSSSESAGGGEKKPGGVGGFFTGVWNGAKNAVKSLATPKGLIMAGVGLAACIAFPVAAPLVLGGIAVAAGGSKMYSAAKNHDAEGVGEGFFTAGAGAAGVWGSGAIGAARAGSASGAGSAGTAATEATGTSSAAAETGGATSSLWSKYNPMNLFRSKPAPAAEGSGAAAEGSGAAAETGGATSSLWSKYNPMNLFRSKPAPAAETSGAAAEGSGAAAEGAAATEGKPGMFHAASKYVGHTQNFIKNPPTESPFLGPLPKNLAPASESTLGRVGQIMTGRAVGPDGITPILPTRPIWSLPSTAAIHSNVATFEQQQAG